MQIPQGQKLSIFGTKEERSKSRSKTRKPHVSVPFFEQSDVVTDFVKGTLNLTYPAGVTIKKFYDERRNPAIKRA